MWDDCYEGKSLLTPASASKLCLSITEVITNWLKSFPEEIIPSILIRLPIKSLIRFTAKTFKTEESLELRLSVSGDRKSIGLFVRFKNESDCFLDIWVMKEYCIEQSWTKLVILSPQSLQRSLPNALCFRRNGEVVLVLEDSRELVSLELVSKQFKALGISGGLLCSVDLYEESLVLLDKKDAVSY